MISSRILISLCLSLYLLSYTNYQSSSQEKAVDDGSQYHGVGILPSVPAAGARAAIAAGRDEFIERALEVVKNTGK